MPTKRLPGKERVNLMIFGGVAAKIIQRGERRMVAGAAIFGVLHSHFQSCAMILWQNSDVYPQFSGREC